MCQVYGSDWDGEDHQKNTAALFADAQKSAEAKRTALLVVASWVRHKKNAPGNVRKAIRILEKEDYFGERRLKLFKALGLSGQE